MSFTGKFERVSCENYDEFLTALDVNEVWKKAALTSTPVMEVSLTVSVTFDLILILKI
jgi:hypothetical protein